MEARYRDFGQKFSAAIIGKDYATASALLAPWLALTPDAFGELIDARVAEMHVEWGIEEPLHPTECQLDGNEAIRPDDLREPQWDGSDPGVPEQLTDDNFRYWMCMQFMPTEGSVEFDAYFDLWAALVDHGGALRVGYFKLADPD